LWFIGAIAIAAIMGLWFILDNIYVSVVASLRFSEFPLPILASSSIVLLSSTPQVILGCVLLALASGRLPSVCTIPELCFSIHPSFESL
jgi:hypothetical protein